MSRSKIKSRPRASPHHPVHATDPGIVIGRRHAIPPQRAQAITNSITDTNAPDSIRDRGRSPTARPPPPGRHPMGRLRTRRTNHPSDVVHPDKMSPVVRIGNRLPKNGPGRAEGPMTRPACDATRVAPAEQPSQMQTPGSLEARAPARLQGASKNGFPGSYGNPPRIHCPPRVTRVCRTRSCSRPRRLRR